MRVTRGDNALQPLDESLDPFHLKGPTSRKTSKTMNATRRSVDMTSWL